MKHRLYAAILPSCSLYNLLGSAAIHVLTSESLQLVIVDERENMHFAFLGLEFLTQNTLS